MYLLTQSVLSPIIWFRSRLLGLQCRAAAVSLNILNADIVLFYLIHKLVRWSIYTDPRTSVPWLTTRSIVNIATRDRCPSCIITKLF